MGGRLKHANLSENAKHAIILPKVSHFTRLVIEDHHLRALHSGTQLPLAFLREKFWVIYARQVIKSIISKCSVCIHHRG